MQHLGTKILETERLLLRPFVLEDSDTMYRNWASDPEVTRFLTWQPHSSPEVTTKILEDWIGQYIRKDYYQWAIVLKAIQEPIGTISIVSQEDRTNTAAIGYCIGRNWWQQGITSEALGIVIEYLLGEVGLNRVEAFHDIHNPNSGAVMRKCGLLYEGTMRQRYRNNQGVCDTCHYAILAEDWRKRQRDFPGKARQN